MKQDRIFDGLSQRFQKKIYSNHDPRGEIRLHIVKGDINKLLHSQQHPLRVLDAGAGMGQMAYWLAQQGHSVTLCEPSKEMMETAKNLFQQLPEAAAAQTRFSTSTIQTFCEDSSEQFDFIICHAVLEWLADPKTTLLQLLSQLKPGAYLSLMFFNKNSKIFRHLLGGDFTSVINEKIASDGHNGLAPISPLLPEEVKLWLPDLGLELLSWSGVRCFYDYSHPEVRKHMPLDQLLTLERRFSQQEPWRSIARYQHFICRKT